jgi:DNA-binding FadR family transcriptional regulator
MSDFLLAERLLHERIASITPNETASALCLSMTRFVGEQPDATTPQSVSGDSKEWLLRSLHAHEELVAAIAAGDISRVKKASSTHADVGHWVHEKRSTR